MNNMDDVFGTKFRAYREMRLILLKLYESRHFKGMSLVKEIQLLYHGDIYFSYLDSKCILFYNKYIVQPLTCVLEIGIVYCLYHKYMFGVKLLVNTAIYSLTIYVRHTLRSRTSKSHFLSAELLIKMFVSRHISQQAKWLFYGARTIPS